LQCILFTQGSICVTQSILERAFSRSRELTKAVLAELNEREKAGNPFYDRDSVRELAKYPVQLGSVTILDALAFSDIKKIVSAKIDPLAALGSMGRTRR
jgi:hypothetical protein